MPCGKGRGRPAVPKSAAHKRLHTVPLSGAVASKISVTPR